MSHLSPHLSALVLDALVADLAAPAEAAQHLSVCAECRVRLERLRREGAALLDAPESERTLDAILRAAPSSDSGGESDRRPRHGRARLRLAVAAAIGLPLAAGLALLVEVRPRRSAPGQAEGQRLKGAASVTLLDSSGRAVAQASVGAPLALAVGGAGLGWAAVLAVDSTGAVSVLWPADASTTGRLTPGARVTLATFAATPGDVAIHALFTQAPRPIEVLQRQLAAAVRDGVSTGVSPLDVRVPAGLVDASASQTLVVR